MIDEAKGAGPAFGVPLLPPGGLGSRPGLNPSVRGPTMPVCGLGTHIFRVGQDARGLRAGALIAVLGGHCAEGRTDA